MTSLSEFWKMQKDIEKIRFHFLVAPFHFPNRTKLKAFLLNQLRIEKKRAEAINYIFCNDKYLLDINRQYLNHDTYTDIVTFELSAKGKELLADIYISIDRVRENANLFNCPISKELHRVIFHGALHLAGYKDKTKEQAEQMRRMEDKWLTHYLVSRGTTSPKH